MAKFPEPPPASQLASVGPTILPISKGTIFWRIYFRGGSHPTQWKDFRFFGPTDARFDHHAQPPSVQARGIMYLAKTGPTCFAEVFQATRTVDRSHRDPWLVAFEVERDLSLLDMTGAWVTRVGASTAIHSGARARARRWSAAIYDAFPSIDGLAYCSSMDANRPAIALYERAVDSMPSTPKFHRALTDPAIDRVINGAAARFGYLVT